MPDAPAGLSRALLAHLVLLQLLDQVLGVTQLCDQFCLFCRVQLLQKGKKSMFKLIVPGLTWESIWVETFVHRVYIGILYLLLAIL